MSQSNLPNPTQNTLIKAPALPTDVPARVLSYDPLVGEEAFSARHPSLRAMDPSQVIAPNCDCSTAAAVSLQVANAASVPPRAAMFTALGTFLGEHTPELLRTQAWTLWYLESRLQSILATKTEARVSPALVDEAIKARVRVVRLLDYHFGDNPLMAAELRDINLGSGFMDLASDMTRLAGHISVHKVQLSADPVNYRADDEAKLRGFANEILAALNGDRSNETADLRNRAWTQLSTTYWNLKAAADFLFRNSPPEMALFPALRTAVVAITSRSRTNHAVAPVVADAVVPSPAAPIATPSPAAPPIGTGLPGGNPLIG